MRRFDREEWEHRFGQLDEDADAMLALANAKCAEKFGTDATNPDRVLKLADILMQRHCAAIAANAASENLSKWNEILEQLTVLSKRAREG